MSTQGNPLSAFFSSFAFHRYRYDPSRDPAEEFERLCAARQWGEAKRERYLARYLSVAEGTRSRPVAIFFRKYEFAHFAHDPSADPSAEFDRLQAARKWGERKLEGIRREFLAALEGEGEAAGGPTPGEVIAETGPDAVAGCPATPARESPLAAFFASFSFRRYTYNPTQDPAEEFERLCVARQWGKARKDKNFKRYLLAIEETRNQPLAAFFRNHQAPRFSHDPLADPHAEFARLQAARNWGDRRLEVVRERFLAVVETRRSATAQPTTRAILERPPIAEFLKERQLYGYTYGDDRPELEFKRLVEAQKRNWERGEREMGRSVKGKESQRRWKADIERTSLQNEFYAALEEQFNARLDKIAGGTGMRRDEVMAELCGVGRAPLSKEEAKEVLKSVHINIFDFLELELPGDITTTDSQTRNLIKVLSPGARALNFPDDAMLGVYSYFTHRVFPNAQARPGATLTLLLRVIGHYFGEFRAVLKKFEKEGGVELVDAVESGPDAVCQLLISKRWESLEPIRAIPGRSHGNLHCP